MESKIKGVSDTALWVAHYRALETKRPDAAFRDPLAERLVGERGREIAESMPLHEIMKWIMVVRTVAIDRLIENSIQLGIDCVVNLGTGLDTRPYRMKLPQNLTWIEVDHPQIIELKNEKLQGEKPQCNLERIALDLSMRDLRTNLFKNISSRFKKILVITEGVIPYLSDEHATELAQSLHSFSEFKYWIQDYYDGGLKDVWRRRKKMMQAAPFLFTAKHWIEFFNRLNWNTKEIITVIDQAMLLGRPFPFVFPISIFVMISRMMPKKWQQASALKRGYVLLERS